MDNNKLERRQQFNGLGITGFLGLTLDWMGLHIACKRTGVKQRCPWQTETRTSTSFVEATRLFMLESLTTLNAEKPNIVMMEWISQALARLGT